MNEMGDPTVTISAEGEELIYRAADGEVKWRWKAPPAVEWKRLRQGQTAPEGLDNGRFRYPSVISGGRVETWFQPERGLDFNLIYDTEGGGLLSIGDAR
jgi:hypothetical protein